MEYTITSSGWKVLSAVEQKLGRSPPQEDIDVVYDALTNQGLSNLAEGASTRYVFALSDSLVSNSVVMKIPARATDFFETYSLEHLGVDQNIRAVYTAKYLSSEGLTPPVIDYSSIGSWVLFPRVRNLQPDDMDEFERKSKLIQSMEELNIATEREFSGAPDVDIAENWGVHDDEVVLRDVGSVYVNKESAPKLDLPDDPIWESHRSC